MRALRDGNLPGGSHGHAPARDRRLARAHRRRRQGRLVKRSRPLADLDPDDPFAGPEPRSTYDLAKRLLVALLLTLVLGYVGYLAIALGANFWQLTLTAFIRGYERILEPAELRGRALRGPGDRVYLLTTQSERIVPLRWRRTAATGRARQLLHVDVWAFDGLTATPVWRTRLRTYEDRGSLMHELLGLDDGTLWLFVREPIGVAVADGTIVADGARLEAANPALAGKRVDEHGYVAFGGQGLQLTLTDSTQWVVDGSLHVERRETAARDRPGIIVPAPEAARTARFQVRGLPIGETRWLGVLTDEEAAKLEADPVVPGRDPNEPRGVMYDFLVTQHVPSDLNDPAPLPYRLWSAKLTKVSNAPRDWPKELPDKWGTRDQFSDYQVLPKDRRSSAPASWVTATRSTPCGPRSRRRPRPLRREARAHGPFSTCARVRPSGKVWRGHRTPAHGRVAVLIGRKRSRRNLGPDSSAPSRTRRRTRSEVSRGDTRRW